MLRPHIDAQVTPVKAFVVNMGPQHPATHGVLRIKLTLDGSLS